MGIALTHLLLQRKIFVEDGNMFLTCHLLYLNANYFFQIFGNLQSIDIKIHDAFFIKMSRYK